MKPCALFMLVLAACKQAPSIADAASTDPPATCTKLGAPCTVAPGKLGTCVEIEKTTGESMFTCQSQH